MGEQKELSILNSQFLTKKSTFTVTCYSVEIYIQIVISEGNPNAIMKTYTKRMIHTCG